ncbi:hypothetical protein S7711_03837 [Stachybotrys chartarum IBT 7711]|uniref:Zn(2)-C6 fungal-type domain-containing protein n=1 Tax=Stachybotrys chartarum (strain CBS 109288 / IBT 7711) TaxID=1280523 RepID=A0A084AUC8_STACB|nr:hypothetical protein S7711_03837 [Stachybotrys chartarum IBT 7711]KFA46924.1 hypothetical protein S40293_03592 [Stachybotrys chartarum IBT 40293]
MSASDDTATKTTTATTTTSVTVAAASTAAATSTSPSSSEGPVSIWNCLSCKRRKVRCDRKKPCTNCARTASNCVYPTSGRLPRRPQHVSSSDASPSNQQPASQADLLLRVKRVEGLLNSYNAQLGGRLGQATWNGQAEASSINVDQFDAASQTSRDEVSRDDSLPTPAPIHQQSFANNTNGPAAHEVNPYSLTSTEILDTIRHEVQQPKPSPVRLLREGLQNSEHATTDPGEATPSASHPTGSTAHASTFLFHPPVPHWEPTSHDLSPLPSQMLFIWETFVQNVDPFLKVLHVPSTERGLRAKKFSMRDMDPATRALMSCISYAAVTTLTEEEIRLNFDADEITLKARFRKGAECALAAADFVTTTELMTIQAATIFLSVLNSEKSSRYVWSLTGVLVRIAASLGLHIDGSQSPGVGPFETEIRRRVWWHICFLDMRAEDSRVHEVLITDSMFNTQSPNNVNDADIYPEMIGPVRSVEGTTDSSICLVRCKAWHLARIMRRKNNDLSLELKIEAIQIFRRSIVQEQYVIPGRDPEAFAFLRTLTGIVADRFELMVLTQRLLAEKQEPSMNQETFGIAVRILEQTNMMRQHMTRWVWIVRNFIHWQPLRIVLSHIGTVPWDGSSEKTWMAVGQILDSMHENLNDEPLWKPLQSLITKVGRHRMAHLQSGGAPTDSNLTGSELWGSESPSPNLRAYQDDAAPSVGSSDGSKRSDRPSAYECGIANRNTPCFTPSRGYEPLPNNHARNLDPSGHRVEAHANMAQGQFIVEHPYGENRDQMDWSSWNMRVMEQDQWTFWNMPKPQ